MLLMKEREIIADYGRKMIDHDLVKGTGGNISIYNRNENLIAISPGGMDYYCVAPEDVVVLNTDGEVIDSDKKPSSETIMHLMLYVSRSDISSIIHTHSVCASALSCLRTEIPPLHYLIGFAGKNVRCADYATYGTKELADNACRAMVDRNAALLANHGLIAGASTLNLAFTIAEMVEYCAELYLKIKPVGKPVLIEDAEMENVIKKFKDYISSA